MGGQPARGLRMPVNLALEACVLFPGDQAAVAERHHACHQDRQTSHFSRQRGGADPQRLIEQEHTEQGGGNRVADNEAELAHLRTGELAVIPSIWGHRAGSPETIPADLEFLTAKVRAWLDR